MAARDVKEFFRQKKKKSGGDIDWGAKKQKWLSALESLYKAVTKKYLADPIAEKTVAVSYADKEIMEEYIGKYTAKELVLQVGDEKVVFSPVGCNIVGATGRVDVFGEMGQMTLVILPEGRWGFIASRRPTLRIVPLDQDTLLTGLKEIMRP
jgi:hypothetical protein